MSRRLFIIADYTDSATELPNLHNRHRGLPNMLNYKFDNKLFILQIKHASVIYVPTLNNRHISQCIEVFGIL